MAGLSRHTFAVELVDGTTFEVSSVLADQVSYETTRARRKWPQITEGGVGTWWAYLAWSAATRTEVWAGKWEEWIDAVVDVDDLTAGDDGAGETVDPTPPAVPVS